jgi:simple sugar transport system substrate-binding protein
MKNSHIASVALLIMVVVLLGCDQQPRSTESSSPSTSPGAASAGKKLVVGYSQIGAESEWRTANSKSIRSEAEKRGIELRFADAQQKQENQVKALRAFVAQKVDIIMFSPVVETGWTPVLREIKQANIPVVLSDRRVDAPDDLYVTFIGSDFVEEGRRAATWLAKKTNGKATIAELQGTVGSAPANDRKKGFEEFLAKHPEMKIIKSQSGDKSPEGSQINAVFGHNDDMALGAIQAIEEAGRKPGTEIIIVSIDGVRGAFEAMVAGKLNCTVECNPLLGPQLFDAVEAIARGETVPKRITVQEGVFDQTQAKEALPTRQY